ncbi:ABC transporter permease subunit [Desulfobulbus alkaliphilus]|uniref:ABC transporter permease subunit n=1 Tax=Desulfobulbus alkaliphilus TaxID=869814 RepID=UPI0019654901|nr:ABC transporter permease subunit [Desulfobulbus alkaliphilus]MBM9536556.1 ABC transporter permease subunit [Desulfobulbus alkaliphilus]
MSVKKRFTGTGRRYKTKRSIKIIDHLARILISLGGVGTIIAVIGVFVYLTSVVVPLFAKAENTLQHQVPLGERSTHDVAFLTTDEHLLSAWVLENKGSQARSFRLDTGENLINAELSGGEIPSAFAYDPNAETLASAFADGRIQLSQISINTEFFVNEQNLPANLQNLEIGQIATYEGGVMQRTPVGQLRRLRLDIDEQPPIATGLEQIQLLDFSVLPSGPVITTLTADGMLQVQNITSRRNMLTGQITTTVSGGEIQLDIDQRGIPKRLMISGRGDTVYLIWPDGHLLRVDSRTLSDLRIAEELTLLPEQDAEITSLSFLIGKTTLMVGDSQGHIRAWFRTRPEGVATADGSTMTMVHNLDKGSAPVTSLGVSMRTRLMSAGFADGSVRVYHVTSNQLLIEDQTFSGPVLAVNLAPRENLVAALTPDGFTAWGLDTKHPAANIRTLFGKVHYEGMNEPRHVWQSASATDDFEPKYSLTPLIFGTLKATFYSMMFGVPLALLAAIYTSEFMENSYLRARLKPLVEVMESLPTVVLGFLAALVFATFVEGAVAGVLAAFITVPLCFVLIAYGLQLLPVDTFIRMSRFRFYFLIFLALPLGTFLAGYFGPFLEFLLFSGDIKAWLDGQVGTGTGGWFIMFLPVSLLAVIFLAAGWLNPWIREKTRNYSRFNNGLVELSKFAAGAVVALVLAWLLASLLTSIGFDSRGDFPVIGQVMGTYVQRNALVVGFVMGFAIIPAVYTIAEDALSSVPEHLRAGSLASGATPWQTAVRIIIPTAASGLFSAVMLGLGRAVGETMIVLMATGNTPVMEWNIFNGFRTLSANIAVELPEAVIFSTHYRVLFLAALTLFLMTFVINTIAEVIRQRFRKRAYQL